VKLARIALRNLARNRRRTLLSLLVIAAGSAALVLTAGFVRFSFAGLEDAIVRGGLGHLEVLPAEMAGAALTERGQRPSLDDWREIRTTIEAVPGVRGAGAVVHLAGVVSKGDRSVPFLGVAVEPDRERRMRFELKLRRGEDLPAEPPAEGDDRVLLGLGLASALGAAPGDVVTALVVTSGGTLNAVDFAVAGIVTTGLQELDARLLKMHLASAERLLETSKVSSLVVGLDDGGATDTLRARIAERLAAVQPPLTVLDWRTRAPFYRQVRGLYSGIFVFLGAIVFVMVCLSTSNTLLMSVMERMREIGTLLALGTSRLRVGLLVVVEALWLGLLGGLVGDLVGLGLALALGASGLRMPPPPGAVDPIPIALDVRAVDLVGAVGLMLVVLAAAAAVPVVRTARIRIVEALGHV
jgi:putative ABC transport system permease protein